MTLTRPSLEVSSERVEALWGVAIACRRFFDNETEGTRWCLLEAFDELNRVSPGWDRRPWMALKYPPFNEKA